MSRIIVALGGNALGDNPNEQKQNIKSAIDSLLPLLKENEVVITHGNGPQVGMINKAFEDEETQMPLAECTAMSEGYIGYHIEEILKEKLSENNIDKKVVCLLTEVEVSKEDKSFQSPSKPIGKFYTKEEYDLLEDKTNIEEDSGRGYRKFVASPEPLDIKDKDTIIELLQNNHIVIACGGGGIPVFIEDKTKACEAVIDKDKASAKLGELINADILIIVTAVPHAQINFGTDNPTDLYNVTVGELDKYIEEGHFKKGSMLPKIEASIAFVRNSDRVSIITSLENVSKINELNSCTKITK